MSLAEGSTSRIDESSLQVLQIITTSDQTGFSSLRFAFFSVFLVILPNVHIFFRFWLNLESQISWTSNLSTIYFFSGCLHACRASTRCWRSIQPGRFVRQLIVFGHHHHQPDHRNASSSTGSSSICWVSDIHHVSMIPFQRLCMVQRAELGKQCQGVWTK